MIKYPIGIDIGVNYIAAAQLQRKGKALAIRGLYYRELNETTGEAEGATDASVIACLQEIAKSSHFSGRHVVLNIPSKNFSVFPIMVHVGEEETLEEAILRESAKYLPFPLQEAIIDYPCLTPESGSVPNSYKATIVAIRESNISPYLSLLRQAGLVVEAVDFSVSALLRLHHYTSKATVKPIILCHIGHKRTLLAAVNEDGILVQSEVTWGSRSLINSILSNIDLSDNWDSARVLLKKYGLVFDSQNADPGNNVSAGDEDMTDVSKTIFQIITPYVDEIIYELYKVISYVRAEKQDVIFDGLFLYGQASGIHHLDHYLEKRLNISTNIVNPLTALAATQHDVVLRDCEEGMFALVLGLAMRRIPWL